MRRRVDHTMVISLRAQQKTYGEIAVIAGCTPMYARLICNGVVERRPGTVSRFQKKPETGKSCGMPAYDNPAFMESRTMFPGMRRDPNDVERALKSGINSAKIGGLIRKGRWKNFPIYTLSIEERATCPMSCRHWRSCYGNNMPFAQRIQHGPALELMLEREVADLAKAHRRGFAIRLHNLGDFYSTAYVEMWSRLLTQHPQLHAFGFSARHDYHGDPIARALIDLVGKRWSRFAIRLSNAPLEACATVSIEHPYQRPPDAIICPAQLGKTESCSTCALCWQTTKRIAFIQH